MGSYDNYWEESKSQKKKLIEKAVKKVLSEVEDKINEEEDMNFIYKYAKGLILDQFKSSKFAKIITKELADQILSNLKISITVNDNFIDSGTQR